MIERRDGEVLIWAEDGTLLLQLPEAHFERLRCALAQAVADLIAKRLAEDPEPVEVCRTWTDHKWSEYSDAFGGIWRECSKCGRPEGRLIRKERRPS